MPESDNGQPRTALLVLGMHRSGTSLLGGLVAGAGVDMGRHLMAAAADNPRGFWENQRLVDLNESLLNTLGQTWASWQALPGDWLQREEVKTFRGRLAELLAAEFGDSPVFCVKDPRLCRLLPVWLEVLGDLSIRPVCLFISRPVTEVAASLEARDGMGPNLARALWLRHGVDAITASDGLPTAKTSYAALLQEPQAFFDALRENTGIALSVADTEFADASLRHHDMTSPPTDAWALPLYDCLRGEGQALPEAYEATVIPLVEQAAELEATLVRSRSGELDSDDPTLHSDRERQLFAEAQEAKQYAGSMQEELRTGREYIEAMQAELSERDRDISEKAQFIASLQSELGERDADIAEKARYLESLKDTLSAREADLEAGQQYATSLVERIAQMEADAGKQAEDYAEGIASRQEYIDSLQTHLQNKEAELEEFRTRFRFFIWLDNTLRGKKHSDEP